MRSNYARSVVKNGQVIGFDDRVLAQYFSIKGTEGYCLTE